MEVNDTERRQSYCVSKLDTRSGENGEPIIEGYFAVFEQETELWDGCYERIARGAFTAALLHNDIRCLFNHESANVMARTKPGTLTLREDEHGLFGSLSVNTEDSMAMDVYARVKRGDISGCSFGFFPVSEEWTDADDGTHWTVKEADLLEVSICTFPAYPQTEIAARHALLDDHRTQMRQKNKQRLKQRLEEKTTCLNS